MAVCQEKYYTLTDKPVSFLEAAGECDNICPGSSVWCPESQSEINDVHSNLVVLNYQYGVVADLDWDRFEEDGMSVWTGIKFDEREHITKDLWPVENKLEQFYCSDNLTGGVFNYSWSSNQLTDEVFSEHDGDITNYDKKCITIGVDLKWITNVCADSNKKRAVCVTVVNKSAEPSYYPMDTSDSPKEVAVIISLISSIIPICILACLGVCYKIDSKEKSERDMDVANDPFF